MSEGNDAELAASGVQIPAPTSSLATPDITPAQVVGAIPIVAEFAHAFGLFTLTHAQEASLSKVVTAAIGLFGADALIRVGRSLSSRL